MAQYQSSKIEFDLTIKKSSDKNREDMYGMADVQREKPKWEVYEELNFKALSAKEVIRRLIDYLED